MCNVGNQRSKQINHNCILRCVQNEKKKNGWPGINVIIVSLECKMKTRWRIDAAVSIFFQLFTPSESERAVARKLKNANQKKVRTHKTKENKTETREGGWDERDRVPQERS